MNTLQPNQLQSISTSQRLHKTPYRYRGCETPSPRPVKKSRHTKLNKPTHGMFNILKSTVVPYEQGSSFFFFLLITWKLECTYIELSFFVRYFFLINNKFY